MIRVLLVDDQALLRMGFRLILEAQPDIEVVGEAGDGAVALGMSKALHPNVVLMDVRMPGMDGIAATAALSPAAIPGTRILILTTYDLDEYVFAGLKAGASGFLSQGRTARGPAHRVSVPSTTARPSLPPPPPGASSTSLSRCCPTPAEIQDLRDHRIDKLTDRERAVFTAGRRRALQPRDRRGTPTVRRNRQGPRRPDTREAGPP